MVNGPQSVFVQPFSESSLSDTGAFFEEQDFWPESSFSATSPFFTLQDIAFEQNPLLPQLFSFAKKVL